MNNEPSIETMIELLADRTIDVGSRDDIVLWLSEEGDERALDILHEIASNPKNIDDVYLIGKCGEAIGMIMCRTGFFDIKYIKDLIPYRGGSALHSVLSSIKRCRPEWYEKYNLDEFDKIKTIKKVEIK